MLRKGVTGTVTSSATSWGMCVHPSCVASMSDSCLVASMNPIRSLGDPSGSRMGRSSTLFHGSFHGLVVGS